MLYLSSFELYSRWVPLIKVRSIVVTSVRIFSFAVFNKRLHNYVWRHAMNIFININVLAFLVISPFGQKLTDLIRTKRCSNPGSSIHYIRSRSTFPVVLFQWAFYSGFSYRAAYHSYVIVIPTMLSLCIFYGSDILLIKRWSYCLSRHPARVTHSMSVVAFFIRR